MSLLSEGTVANDGCLLRQMFQSRRWVQDASGLLVGCNVGLYGPGLRPTAASSRITYNNTQNVLANAAQATWRLRYRTPAVFADAAWLHKVDQAWGATLHWGFEFTAAGLMVCYLGAAAANFFRNAVHSPSTTYIEHFVFNGGLAAGDRGKVYWNGVAQATSIGGVLPTTLVPTAYPVTVFNRANGVNRAPATDAVLLDFAIWGKAMTAAEVLDNALDRTYDLGGP